MKFLLLLIFVTNLSFAMEWQNPCRVGLQGELLYFKATDEQIDFVVENAHTPMTSKVIHNDPPIRAGFRVEAIYALDALHDVHVRYTRFNPGNHKREFLLTTDQTQKYLSQLHLKYYSVEALLSRLLYCFTDFHLTFMGGILYANLQCEDGFDRFNGETPILHTFSQSHFSGVGPELLIDLKYPLPFRKFSILFNTRGALLASRLKNENRVNGQTIFANSNWSVTPYIDSRFGLGWNTCVARLKTHLEIGYEWIWHRRASRKLNLDFFSHTYSNISFQGPYAAIGIAF